jgi:hypothetical protein
MYLLCDTPGNVFDGRRMNKEFESKKSSPQAQNRVAGTTEVGVRKYMGKRKGESSGVEILLKPKVVLEKDLVDSEDGQ